MRRPFGDPVHNQEGRLPESGAPDQRLHRGHQAEEAKGQLGDEAVRGHRSVAGVECSPSELPRCGGAPQGAQAGPERTQGEAAP